MRAFLLHIVTPSKDFYSGEVEYVSVGTPDGREGFLAGAMPRVTALSAGRIDVKTSVLEMHIVCGSGLVSVTENGVTILSESCRFEGETDDAETTDGDSVTDGYDIARAQLGTSIKNMRKRRGTDVK